MKKFLICITVLILSLTCCRQGGKSSFKQNLLNNFYLQYNLKGDVVFSSDQSGHMEIYIMNLSNSFPEPLTNFNADSRYVSFSNSGEKIAFASTKDSPKFELYIMDINKKSILRVTNNDYEDRYPSWGDNDKKLVFESTNSYGDNDLFIIDIATGEEHRLTNTADNQSPSFSPKEDLIAFTSNRNGNYDIYTITSEGIDVRQITNTETLRECNPCWSPDGEQLVYGASGSTGKEDIFIINKDGSGKKKIVSNPADDTSPSWSSNGEWILFSSNRDGNNMDIYITDKEGKRVFKLIGSCGVDIGAKMPFEVIK